MDTPGNTSRKGALAHPSSPPNKWTVRQLLDYCGKHDITVARGLSKEELAAIVDEHLTDSLLAAQVADTLALTPAHLADLSGLSGAELIGRQPYGDYGKWLREHLDTLHELVAAGVAQLDDTDWFNKALVAKQTPPLILWMTACLQMDDGGKSSTAALTPAAASSAVCGHYFTRKEMVARCEECSADGTCVFCMDCFQHSPCRGHRFRITASGGGGMCDCGDPSAWKKESFCPRHRGHREDEDPSAALSESARGWATIVLRGAVQAISLTLNHACEFLQNKPAKKRTEKAAPTPGELVSLVKTWLSELVEVILAISQVSEAAKRLLSGRWVEALGDANGANPALTSFTSAPCLDAVFRFQTSVTDKDVLPKADKRSWWAALTQSVAMGLSDPFFRNHYLTMMGKYAERLSRSDSLDDYAVQVFTNVDAIHYALLPQHMPYQGAKDTIVHRTIGGCLYYFTSEMVDVARFDKTTAQRQAQAQDPSTDVSSVAALTSFAIDDTKEAMSLGAFSKLIQCVQLDNEAGVLAVLNSRAMRGIQALLHIVDVSSQIHKTPDAPTLRYIRSATFAGRYLVGLVRAVQSASRKVLAGYEAAAATATATQTSMCANATGAKATATESASKPDALNRQCMVHLGVADDIADEIFRGGCLDTPPDPVAAASTTYASARRVLAASSAGVSDNSGRHLPFQIEAQLTPSEQQDPAFRCIVAQLHCVREYLIGYLVHQHNALRHNNRAIVLEARSCAHSVASPGIAPPEKHIYEYNLLEPTAHATGTTNLLSRLFMMLVQAWVLHTHRGATVAGHAGQKSVLPITRNDTNPLRRRLPTRRTGVASGRAADTATPGLESPQPTAATTMTTAAASTSAMPAHRVGPVSRLAELLIAHEVVPDATAAAASAEAETAVHQQGQVPGLLRNIWFDSMVMPFVLLGQVEHGAWRRDEYNVCYTMRLYRDMATKAHLEYDLYALQMLTTVMPPGDFALQALQRFSYDSATKASTHKKKRKAGVDTVSAARHNVTSDPSAKGRTPKAGAHKTHDLRGNRSGYVRYLRLMLTLVLNNGKASGTPDFSQDTVTRLVAQALAQERCTHSKVVASVEGALGSGTEEDEEATLNIKAAVRSALKEVAVEEKGQKGSVFRLKDTHTWQRLVSVYSPQFSDPDEAALYLQYTSTVRREQLDKGKASPDADTGSANATQPIHFPPPSLPTTQAAELVPHLRALLHTDALLLSSLAVIEAYVTQLNARAAAQVPAPQATAPTTEAEAATQPARRVVEVTMEEEEEGEASSVHDSEESGTSQSESHDDSDDEWDDADDASSEHSRTPTPGLSADTDVLPSAVQHAVTVLFLCAKDTVELSRALRFEKASLFVTDEGGEASVSMTEAVAEEVEEEAVDWDQVAEFLANAAAVHTSSESPEVAAPPSSSSTLSSSASEFTDDTVRAVLPLASLQQAGTLRSLLAKPMPLGAFETVGDLLHAVWRRAHDNPKEDQFSIADMLRYVLTLTGLADQDVLEAGSDKGQVTSDVAGAALARKEKLKERQAKLLQRMQARAKVQTEKDKVTISAGAGGGQSTTESHEARKDSSTNSALTPRDSLFLHTRLLLRLTTLECCVCRVSSDEPLLFIGNCSTSGVLHHLRAVPLPDGRSVHAHWTLCGHAAHAGCVRKHFTQLSKLWQRGVFLGQRFLGPSEFACPICLMVSQTQIPVPVIAATASIVPSRTAAAAAELAKLDEAPTENENIGISTRKTESAVAESIFEEIRRGSLADKTQQEASANTLTAVAHATIGFCASGDHPALVIAEDELQKSNDEAWTVSESIRTVGTQIRLLVESVKVGRAVHEHDLLAILSLMLSIPPTHLATHHDVLRKNFVRCGEAWSVLILECLHAPAKAGHRIADGAVDLLRSVEAAEVVRVVIAASTAAPAVDEEGVTQLEAPAMQHALLATWTELACLTLFKALLLDEPADTVLAEGKQDDPYAVSFVHMTADALATQPTRCQGLLRMTQYLTQIPLRHMSDSVTDVATALLEALYQGPSTTSLAQDEEASTPSSCVMVMLRLNMGLCDRNASSSLSALTVYHDPSQWAEHVLHTVLHLPQQYMTILADFAKRKVCDVCGADDPMSAQCRFCEKRLCLKPTSQAPELRHHAVSCGQGLGVFLRVDCTRMLVTDAVSGRCVEAPPLYVDEFDETDENMVRGTPLYLSRTAATRFLHTWLMNRWAVESSLLRQTWRGNLDML